MSGNPDDPFDLKALLAQRRVAQRYRTRRVQQGPSGREAVVGGRRLINFAGNDYLGLASHPEVVKAFRDAASTSGVGSGASHLVTGHSHWHHRLEEALADYTGRERALLFSTGYMANLGVLSALLRQSDAVFEDRLNHASLIDGGLAAGARFRRYRHNDVAGLEHMLARGGGERRLVVTDGVFSMDGDLAPLPDLLAACRSHDAWLMVDDAHGLGVIGPHGRGTLAHFGCEDQVPVLVGTLGKAFGTFGAFVAGSEDLIEALVQLARPYIYTTAMPPAVAAATLASLERVRKDEWRREHLHALIQRLREGAASLGIDLMDSRTPIQPLVLGSDGAALAAAEKLDDAGFLVPAIRPPTVPARSARLRITLSAAHTEEDVDRLLDALAALRPLMEHPCQS